MAESIVITRSLLAELEAEKEQTYEFIACRMEEMAQHLVVLKLEIGLLSPFLKTAPAEFVPYAMQARQVCDTIIQMLDFMRGWMYELRPPLLESDFDLVVRLEAQKFTRDSGIPCDCRNAAPDGLPIDTRLFIFRILQDVLHRLLADMKPRRVSMEWKNDAIDKFVLCFGYVGGSGTDTAEFLRIAERCRSGGASLDLAGEQVILSLPRCISLPLAASALTA